MADKRRIIPVTILFAAAIALVLYPYLASLWNACRQQQMVARYEENVSGITDDEYALLVEEAMAWNQELYAYVEPSYFPEGLTDTQIYESLLNLNGDGMMGYVEIPKINVNLPIYHYATDDVLLQGAGHLPASSLPVGGTSTHCVITAHRGLPSAEMFTNLDRLDSGDVFYLHVLGDTYAYVVTQIRSVSPEETQTLLPVEGEDLCTLVTCTPYGVNTYRLLVTGTRTALSVVDSEAEETTGISIHSNRLLLPAAIAEILLYILIMRRMYRDERKSGKDRSEMSLQIQKGDGI